MIKYKIRGSYWLTFALIIVNFNHFFVQLAPGFMLARLRPGLNFSLNTKHLTVTAFVYKKAKNEAKAFIFSIHFSLTRMPDELGYFNHMAITWNIDGNLFFYFNGNQTHISSSFATGIVFDKPGSSNWAIGGNSIMLNAIRIGVCDPFLT